MTLDTEAKRWHEEQLKVAGVKRMHLDRRNYVVVIGDAMKGLYSLMRPYETWDAAAHDLVNNYRLKLSPEGGILALVFDLYGTRNQLRQVVQGVRNPDANDAVEEDEEEKESTTAKTPVIPLPEVIEGHDYKVPPPGIPMIRLAKNRAWRTKVVLPKIGEVIRRMHLPGITIVVRGACPLPHGLSAAAAAALETVGQYNRNKSYGCVSLVPSKEDADAGLKTRAITDFDDISCVGEAEADNVTVSMAEALREHWEELNPILCPNFRPQSEDGKKPDFLLMSGDGDIISVALMAAARRMKMKGIDLALLDIDWAVSCVYDIQEAADKLGAPGYQFGSIYVYCAFLFICGADYVKKINSVTCRTLMGAYKHVFRKRAVENLDRLSHPVIEALVGTEARERHLVSPRILAKEDTDTGFVYMNFLTWMILIVRCAEARVADCECLAGVARECGARFRSKADNKKGIPRGSTTHISLHQLMGTLACLETSINYFAQAPDPRYLDPTGHRLSPVSGFHVLQPAEGKGVVFGIEKPTKDSPVSRYFFCNVDES